jgi:hypothetical protein
MSNEIPCPKCGKLNELYLNTCVCSGCNQSYGQCKKCGQIFDASGGVSGVCPECRGAAAAADSDGTFIGNLDAKIMNSNHNLENWLLRLFIAIPLLKPLKLRRKGGVAWWIGTLWLTFYVGAVLAVIATYGLKAGGAHPDLCSGIMGWGTAFLLFLPPRLISLISRGGSKKVKITTIVVLVLDVVAIVLAYMFSVGPWVGEPPQQEEVQEGISEREFAAQEQILTDTRNGNQYETVTIDGKKWMNENLDFETEGSWCYANDNANCQKYGRLYTWRAAQTACPEGWHLASENEWSLLINNADEFEVLLSGFRNSNGKYELENVRADFWTSDIAANARGVYYYYSANSKRFSKNTYDKQGGMSVRCVSD